MKRIDIVKTIEANRFRPRNLGMAGPDRYYRWESQKEAIVQEKGFLADTPYKRYLICTINKDPANDQRNIFAVALRDDPPSSVTRPTPSESLITQRLHHIRNQERRALQFWGYMDIEAYKITQSLLEWEGSTAKPTHVEKMKEFKESNHPGLRKQQKLRIPIKIKKSGSDHSVTGATKKYLYKHKIADQNIRGSTNQFMDR